MECACGEEASEEEEAGWKERRAYGKPFLFFLLFFFLCLCLYLCLRLCLVAFFYSPFCRCCFHTLFPWWLPSLFSPSSVNTFCPSCHTYVPLPLPNGLFSPVHNKVFCGGVDTEGACLVAFFLFWRHRSWVGRRMRLLRRRLRCSFSAPNRRDVMQCELATLLYSYFGYVELVQALEADSSSPPLSCRYICMYDVCTLAIRCALLSSFFFSLLSPVPGPQQRAAGIHWCG